MPTWLQVLLVMLAVVGLPMFLGTSRTIRFLGETPWRDRSMDFMERISFLCFLPTVAALVIMLLVVLGLV